MKKKPPKPSGPAAAAADPLFRARKDKGKRKTKPSTADMKLWTQVTETVEPLDKALRESRVLPMPEPIDPGNGAPAPKRRAPARPVPAPVMPAVGPAPPHRPEKTELTHGATAGIDKRTAQKFKKGKMAIQGRLDLHGHTQREAHVALKRFVADAYADEKRCVLVVTGKGRRGYERGGPVGVLRDAVPRWLNDPALRAKVLSFSYAAPSDGGEGALYVLLKRRRGD